MQYGPIFSEFWQPAPLVVLLHIRMPSGLKISNTIVDASPKRSLIEPKTVGQTKGRSQQSDTSATPPSLKKTPEILPRLSYPASWVLAHAPIVATNIMAKTSAAPNRQAKAAGMMVFIIDTPVHGYDAIKLIAGRALCSDWRHIGAAASLKCAIL